jgi:hypothetical protein
MFDARIEISIYHLLRTLGLSAGPWIGAPVSLSDQSGELPAISASSVLEPEPVAVFEPCAVRGDAGFLSVREGLFAEQAHDRTQLSQVSFEYILPRSFSLNSVVALPVAKIGGRVFVGLELRDLPAVQSFSGSSRILTASAWRLPQTINHWTELPWFLSDAMRRDFNISVRHAWEIGGAYLPSPGVTPEVVYPFLAEVEASEIGESRLQFIEISDLKSRIGAIQEGHLLIAAGRIIHALDQTGFTPESPAKNS